MHLTDDGTIIIEPPSYPYFDLPLTVPSVANQKARALTDEPDHDRCRFGGPGGMPGAIMGPMFGRIPGKP